MNKEKFKFIIYTPPFNENSGGVVALHKLCDLLNKNGENAYIFFLLRKPKIDDHVNFIMKLLYPLRLLKFYIVSKIPIPIGINKELETPRSVYIPSDNSKTIVIYPEIVSGNPLNAKNVVRWLLHKPGFHTGEINYGKDDIFFFYQVIFNDSKLNPHNDHLLTVLWVRDDIYKQTNFDKRYGTCYMIRKGKDRKIIHDTENSVLLDEMSHSEIAKIMNKCEYFVSYDMETMYSQYAVLCGCKSIVIPLDMISKIEWQPKKELRYGIAYGFDDIKESDKTKDLVYDILKKIENDSNSSVLNFINSMYKFFGNKI